MSKVRSKPQAIYVKTISNNLEEFAAKRKYIIAAIRIAERDRCIWSQEGEGGANAQM